MNFTKGIYMNLLRDLSFVFINHCPKGLGKQVVSTDKGKIPAYIKMIGSQSLIPSSRASSFQSQEKYSEGSEE